MTTASHAGNVLTPTGSYCGDTASRAQDPPSIHSLRPDQGNKIIAVSCPRRRNIIITDQDLNTR